MERIVFVVGPPASGKTVLAAGLAARTGYPVLSRDALKEQTFDVLGWQDVEWSQKVGKLSYQLLHSFVGLLVAGEGRAIIESNFDAVGLRSIREVLVAHRSSAFVVYARADVETLAARYRSRATVDRHPGHGDGDRTLDGLRRQFEENLSDHLDAIPGRCVEVWSSEPPDILADRVFQVLAER